MAKMLNSCQMGHYKEALMLHDKLTPLHNAMFCEPSPAPAKYAAHRLGHCANELRLPLTPLSDDAGHHISAILKQLGLG